MMIEQVSIPIPSGPQLKNDISMRRGRHLVGAWAIAPEYLQDAICMVAESPAKVSAAHQESIGAGVVVRGKTAVIPITGIMSKFGSWDDLGSTVQARSHLAVAGADPNVEDIMLLIESPGGSAAGTAELADAVYATRLKKRVVAYIEDIGASAAYWVASQADAIYANESAMVGSIGAFSVITDWTKALDDYGIKVHIIRSGPYKGAGAFGTAIEDQHLEHWQHMIDSLASQFTGAVAKGRRMSMDATRQISDGRVFTAREAKDRGLIDGIISFEDALAIAGPTIPVEASDMSGTESTMNAAGTLAELEQSLPNASAEFLVGQLRAGATVASAQAAWLQEVESQLASTRQSLAMAEAEVAKRATSGEAVTQPIVGTTSHPPTSERSAPTKAQAFGSLREHVKQRAEEIRAANPHLRPIQANIVASNQVKMEHPELFDFDEA